MWAMALVTALAVAQVVVLERRVAQASRLASDAADRTEVCIAGYNDANATAMRALAVGEDLHRRLQACLGALNDRR